jgi:ABC-type branched-subunit amino acid transport system ATPase component
MAKKKPWMVVLAGPNGAGKSTFYDQVQKLYHSRGNNDNTQIK